jgi:hypothetical protein
MLTAIVRVTSSPRHESPRRWAESHESRGQGQGTRIEHEAVTVVSSKRPGDTMATGAFLQQNDQTPIRQRGRILR